MSLNDLKYEIESTLSILNVVNLIERKISNRVFGDG